MNNRQNIKSTFYNLEDLIDLQEGISLKELPQDLNEHLEYFLQIYNFCFEIKLLLDSEAYNEIRDETVVQAAILMRITDFLKNIILQVIKGYPSHSAALAVSLFEMAHISAYFLHTPETAIKWLNYDSVDENVLSLIGVNDYKTLVDHNYAAKDMKPYADLEYNLYKKLCQIKDLHLIKQDQVRTNDKMMFTVEPGFDENSIRHAWFCIQHSGRLTELAIGNLCGLSDVVYVLAKLEELASIRENLNKKAITRFGSTDPFK